MAETATRVGEVPGHHADAFATVARSGTVRSPYQPAGSTNLDGLLDGPYVVLPGETDAQLLQQMVGRFDTVAGAVNLGAGAAALGMSPYQVVTAASIVEKEGVYSENLGKVARVIYNRLAKGVPLQMDSTVLYSRGARRRPRHRRRPHLEHPVQHVPAQGPHAHAHLLALQGVAKLIELAIQDSIHRFLPAVLPLLEIILHRGRCQPLVHHRRV